MRSSGQRSGEWAISRNWQGTKSRRTRQEDIGKRNQTTALRFLTGARGEEGGGGRGWGKGAGSGRGGGGWGGRGGGGGGVGRGEGGGGVGGVAF